MADDAQDPVEMVVESVRVHMLSSRHVVILKDTTRERYLPIWIGPWEASSIAMRLQGMAPERPLTHDLFATALEELAVRVDRILIHALADETFHARLVLIGRDSRHELDARPSDAIALAIRVGAPIYAAPEVLDAAALASDADADEDAEGGATGEATGLESTGERIPDARLDVFREFVNSLDVEDKGEGRGPQS